MPGPLDRNTAFKALQQFFEKKPFVLFGTGTSCAIHTDFGMGKLEEHLRKEIPREPLTGSQQQEWEALLTCLEQGKDFESSMNMIQDEDLRLKIIDQTSILVSALDKEYGHQILSGKIEWPAARLFKRIFDSTKDSDGKVHAATTNYELLGEYAFEFMGIPYLTGFYGGVCRQLDWKEAERSLVYYEMTVNGRRPSYIKKHKKHIRLYKVHGSINTFKVNDKMVQNNAWMYGDLPREYERVMITPGTAKYEALHANRSDLLGAYDDAVGASQSFLFIGFGFNDNQLINDKIKKKLKEENCHGLILTRGSNDRIEKYVAECKNLWLVCKDKQDGKEGTRISNSAYDTSLFLEGENLWDASEFTRVILGG